MDSIEDDGIYDFYYVSLVTNKCTHANQRKSQFNLYGYPTVYWDGGYDLDLGAGSTPSAKATFIGSINYCGNATVIDVDVDVDVQWQGNATFKVTVTIVNNHYRDYDGNLRAFVVEKNSSLGWKDGFNLPYTNPMLDWAFNQTISVPAGTTWSTTTTWVGAQHNNGYGVNYGNVTYDNIQVIAAVYNDTAHQKYSKPPNAYPFTAYYADDADGAMTDSLVVDTDVLPQSGGVINFNLYAGTDNASRNYFMLGSVSGIEPGVPLPGGMVTLPLNWDAFTDLIIGLANSAALPNFSGVLDATGQGSAQLNSLGPVPPTAVGLVMNFAYLLYYTPTFFPYDYVSNPVTVEVTP